MGTFYHGSVICPCDTHHICLCHRFTKASQVRELPVQISAKYSAITGQPVLHSVGPKSSVR